MYASILESIKKSLGIDVLDISFDEDITMHINSAILGLSQICVGLNTNFLVIDNTQEWSLFEANLNVLSAIKGYIYNKVKLAFDPPSTSFVLDALTKQTLELEWRLNVGTDLPVVVDETIE